MTGYGICYELLAWIKCFLTERSQRVVYRSSKSRSSIVRSGVPQGSVLGPLLFLLYINDLPDVFSGQTHVKMYADDAKIYRVYERHNCISELQSNLDLFFKWSEQWQLSIAFNKCQVLHLGYHNLHPVYTLGDSLLQSCNQVKDLGVIMSSNLDSTAHCAEIASRATARIGVLFRSFSTKDHRVLVLAYTVYIRPILEYASTVWSPHHNKDVDMLESVQAMFTRRLYRRCRLTYTESNLRGEFLALSALVQRRQRADLTMCWKLLHGKLNQSYAELLTLAGDRLSGPSTRSNGYKLAVQRSRLDVRKFFFSCRVARVWNRLPAIVVSSNTVAAFKVRLDELQPP